MLKIFRHSLLVVCALFVAVGAMAQTTKKVTVSGVVTAAEDGQPLLGATVVTQSMSGVTTQIDGTYTIEAEAGTLLTFQYIGYQTQTWNVPTDVAEAQCNIALQADAQVVDDVVVIAYGTRKKGTVTGSVSTVKAEKIEDTPAATRRCRVRWRVFRCCRIRVSRVHRP